MAGYEDFTRLDQEAQPIPAEQTGTPFAPPPQEMFEGTEAGVPGAPEPAVDQGNPYAEFQKIDQGSTPTQKIGAFTRSVTGSLIVGSGIMAGAASGAAAGALTGPAAPVAVPVLALTGAVAGWWAGAKAKDGFANTVIPGFQDPLTIRSVDELPPDQRPFAYAGEVVGGSIPFAGAPMVMAQAGAKLPSFLGGNYLNHIIETARTAPVAFAAAEAASAGGAALAGGTAEAVAPGQETVRLTSEVVGGFMSPSRLFVSGWRSGHSALNKVMSRISPAAMETEAGKILRNAIETAGEDPELVARMLKNTDMPGVVSTAAQKSGSQGLAKLEAEMREQHRGFGDISRQQVTESMEALAKAATLLRGTGDPEALKAAAKMRDLQFRTLLQSKLSQAEDKAVAAARAITNDTSAARARLSVTARDSIDEAMGTARQIEDELWGKVGSYDASPDALLARYSYLRGEMLPRERMPEVIEGTITDIRAAQKVMDDAMSGKTVAPEKLEKAQEMFKTDFLVKFRRQALRAAREAAKKDNDSEARVYGQLAEATLGDLGKAFQGDEAYDVARSFSRELNDVFTRSFAGAARATGARGAEQLPPELLLKRALASGEELGALRLAELEDAVRFIPLKAEEWATPDQLKAAWDNMDAMLDAQRRLLRISASSATDPVTGQASRRGLEQFKRKHEALLDRFPEVRQIVDEAIGSQEAFESFQTIATKATRAVAGRAAFAKVIKSDNVSDVIRGAINSSQPVTQLAALARMARSAGPEAVEGMKNAVWGDVMRAATTQDSGLKLQHFISGLVDPLRPGGPSMLQTLQKESIITPEEVNSLTQVIERMRVINNALAINPTGAPIDPSESGVLDAAFDVMLRTVGSRAAGVMAHGAGAGQGLIAAQRGSFFARHLFTNMPNTNKRNILAHALSDPKFAAELMERPANAATAVEKARQINAYLIQAGLEALSPDDERELSPAAGKVPAKPSSVKMTPAAQPATGGPGSEEAGSAFFNEPAAPGAEDALEPASPGAEPEAAPASQQQGQAATEFDRIAEAVMQVESGGRDDVVSPKGAEGRMQVLPGTQKDPGFGVEPAKDDSPEEKARVGRDYLQAMITKYGKLEHALAAYNWGPSNVDRWISRGAKNDKLPKETQNYIKKVRRLLKESQ